MTKRERVSKKPTSSKKVEHTEHTPAKKVDTEALKSDLDDILDEIDSVLVENAEEFIRSFVQKGGE